MTLPATSPDLKPSPKHKKNTKNNQKKKEKEKHTKKTQKYPRKKKLFSYQSNFLFWWVPKNFPLLTTWPKTRAPPKHYKKTGVSESKVLKNSYASRNGHFWTQKIQIRKFQLSYICCPYSFFNNKQKCSETPILWCFSKVKKEIFSKSRLKTQNIEKPNFCTPFLKKANFSKVPDNWTKNKNTK